MKIGVTGHQNLPDPAWVRQEIMKVLQAQTIPLTGVSSLAVGADQIFAQSVLECDGTLYVIIPFEGYEDVFEATGRQGYNNLLEHSSKQETLTVVGSHEESYLAAGRRVVDVSDLLVVVWNGKAAAGLGGTGDVVQYAQSQKKSYIHINTETKEVKSYLKLQCFK